MTIEEYLLSLDPSLRKIVMGRMTEKRLKTTQSVYELNAGCGQQPIGPGSTPNGEWECISGSWVWIPDIG